MLKKILIVLLAIALAAAPATNAADVSITAASVSKTTGQQSAGTAGGVVTAGMPLQLNSSGQLIACQATSLAGSTCVGIALNGAASGQPVFYQTSGTITYNAAFTVGIVYVVSAANPGAIAPFTDLTTGNYVTILGVAQSTTVLQLSINVSGIHQ